MDLPSAVSNVDSTLTRVTQTPSEIRSDRLLVAYSTWCPITDALFCVLRTRGRDRPLSMVSKWRRSLQQYLSLYTSCSFTKGKEMYGQLSKVSLQSKLLVITNRQDILESEFLLSPSNPAASLLRNQLDLYCRQQTVIVISQRGNSPFGVG